MSKNVHGEDLCEFSEMVAYSCSHCTGRWGDEDLEILEL